VSTRVLVTGAGGQVGVDLVDVLRGITPPGGDPSFQPDGRPIEEGEFEVLGLTHHDLDITNTDAVEHSIAMARPDVIVHLAAYTAVDRAEDDVENAFAVNAQGTRNLVASAHRHGAHFIYVSTDYVFDGQKGEGYVEDDEANPVGVYAKSKYEGELACTDVDTIVRVSWVMGVRGKNIAAVIAQRCESGETVRFVNDQTGTVTLAADLARALVCFVRDTPGGIWHVTNSGVTTWFGVAETIGALLGRSTDFAFPIATSELSPQPKATRPTRSDLTSLKFASRYQELPAWQDGLARLLRDRKTVQA
jgi:dTDP-4-dehydrorhamnose reductase